MQFVSNLQSK